MYSREIILNCSYSNRESPLWQGLLLVHVVHPLALVGPSKWFWTAGTLEEQKFLSLIGCLGMCSAMGSEWIIINELQTKEHFDDKIRKAAGKTCFCPFLLSEFTLLASQECVCLKLDLFLCLFIVSGLIPFVIPIVIYSSFISLLTL